MTNDDDIKFNDINSDIAKRYSLIGNIKNIPITQIMLSKMRPIYWIGVMYCIDQKCARILVTVTWGLSYKRIANQKQSMKQVWDGRFRIFEDFTDAGKEIRHQ